MNLKIKETLRFDAGRTEYTFNVISERDGIHVFLTDWRHQIEGMKLKRWAHVGNDGTFVRRDTISIPPAVIDSVKSKVVDSIQFDID